MLNNEELHTRCASPHITRVIIERRMGWAGHAACIGKMKNAYKI
jgi:hypothetical protein